MSGEGTESGRKYEKELEFWLSSAHVTYTYAGTLPYARSMHTFLACKFLLEKDWDPRIKGTAECIIKQLSN